MQPMTGFDQLTDKALSDLADLIYEHQDGNPFYECDYEAAFDEMERRGFLWRRGGIMQPIFTRHWTVVWDYIGGDCGDLPGAFDSEAEAKAYGEEWADEMNAVADDDVEPGADGWAVYHVIRHEADYRTRERRTYNDGKLIRTAPLSILDIK